jgi:hypothetical protein
MSQQYNHKHGVKSADFVAGSPVFLLNYRRNNAYWLTDRVTGLKGSRTYVVFVPLLNASVHRHANQLRSRPESYETVQAAGHGEEPGYNEPNQAILDNEPEQQNENQQQHQVLRRSNRQREQRVQFEIDPKKKSYRN